MSVPTVSRVLTGAVPVSEERRARVHEAIRQIGYRPNGAARALVRGRQPIIAVFTSTTTSFAQGHALRGIEQAAREAGQMVVVTVVDPEDPASVEPAVDLVLAQPVAGAIVLNFDGAGRALAAVGDAVPAVSVGVAEPTDALIARLDVGPAARAATRHLLDLGHPTVHYAGLPPPLAPGGRIDGWRAALRESGIEPPDLIRSEFEPEAGAALADLVLADPTITALLCASDELAFGLMAALADRGRTVPDDLSVVGFADVQLAPVWRPALTTVRLDFDSLGRYAYALLDRALGGERELPPLVEPEFIVRDTTGPPRS